MKKKKPMVLPAALLPNKKKEMLKLVNNPEQLNKVMDLISASSNLFEQSKTLKAKTMIEWEERCILILPDDLANKEDFIAAFKTFINNYGDNNATTNE